MSTPTEPRQRFLQAFRRATQIEVEAATAFAALRELGDRLREFQDRRVQAETEIQQLRHDPSAHGARAHRLASRRAIAAAQRRLEEIRIAAEVVRELQEAQQPHAQRLATQRDATEKLIERMRFETEALIEAEVRAAIADQRKADAAAGASRHPTPSVGA